MQTYDLVIIGTGVAASGAAQPVREAGWSVAVVDNRPFGGTCALRGCDPKKVLYGGAATADLSRRLRAHGLAGGVRVDWSELVAFKRSFTQPVPGQREQHFADLGIDQFHGTARFIGPDRLVVGSETLTARHILLACGARPRPLGIPGHEHLITSDDFMELDVLPRRIIMVGGGYIAAEFSAIAAAAGSQVTILQHGPRMLSPFDPDLVGWLTADFPERGIELHTNTDVEALELVDDGCRVHARRDGQSIGIDADLVVHAAGRVPALDDLDLAAAGIDVQDGRLQLTPFLQSTSNPRVFAAGDAAGQGPPLTPVASRDGATVAQNLLDGGQRHPDYSGTPSVAFSLPPIAAVGLSEAKAREHGLDFRISAATAADWYTACRLAEPVYGYKILIGTTDDRIIGAHLVGPQAEDTINLFALAIRHGITAGDLKAASFAYPTAASDIASML